MPDSVEMGSVLAAVTLNYHERSPDHDGSDGTIGPVVRQRIRLYFSKKGNLCFIGHRDLLRTMDRLLRRAQLPLAMTQGFHPKPKISYLSALPLGYQGLNELMEIVLEESRNELDILSSLNKNDIEGLEFHRAESIDEHAPKMKAVAFDYCLDLMGLPQSEVQSMVETFMAKESQTAVKPNGKTVEVRRYVRLLFTDDAGTLFVRLAVADGPEATIRELLACLGLEKELFKTVFPVRLGPVLNELQMKEIIYAVEPFQNGCNAGATQDRFSDSPRFVRFVTEHTTE